MAWAPACAVERAAAGVAWARTACAAACAAAWAHMAWARSEWARAAWARVACAAEWARMAWARAEWAHAAWVRAACTTGCRSRRCTRSCTWAACPVRVAWAAAAWAPALTRGARASRRGSSPTRPRRPRRRRARPPTARRSKTFLVRSGAMDDAEWIVSSSDGDSDGEAPAGFEHVFSWVPTEEELRGRTRGTESEGKLFLRNLRPDADWAALVDERVGLLAQVHRTGGPVITDLRVEIMDETNASKLTLKYNGREQLCEHDGFGPFHAARADFAGAAPALVGIGKRVSRFCPQLETLSLFGLRFLPATAAFVRSDVLRSVDLSGLDFTAFPRNELFLRYLVLGAPNLRSIAFGALADLEERALGRFLGVSEGGDGGLLTAQTVANEFFALPDPELELVPHPLIAVEALSFRGCRTLSEHHFRALVGLPALKRLDISGCLRIESLARQELRPSAVEELVMQGLHHLVADVRFLVEKGTLGRLRRLDVGPFSLDEPAISNAELANVRLLRARKVKVLARLPRDEALFVEDK
eukprot:gnl/Chilomastix_cuspidata/291.p1 GENE.gnl/Chilomastix_cuspidata/291~~gnl/Chilomastix_cuspidata/291.p1  ORF type:complete len:530 (-),score=141.32 gnl/Chilomastix_cuspidata/291:162-1751(-)